MTDVLLKYECHLYRASTLIVPRIIESLTSRVWPGVGMGGGGVSVLHARTPLTKDHPDERVSLFQGRGRNVLTHLVLI